MSSYRTSSGGGRKRRAGRPTAEESVVRVKTAKQRQDRLAQLITEEDVETALTRLRELANGVIVAKLGFDTDQEVAKARYASRDPLKWELLVKVAEEMGVILLIPGTRVYYDKPDRQAAQYLIDQKHGMPISRAEIGGPGGGAAFGVHLYLPKRKGE